MFLTFLIANFTDVNNDNTRYKYWSAKKKLHMKQSDVNAWCILAHIISLRNMGTQSMGSCSLDKYPALMQMVNTAHQVTRAATIAVAHSGTRIIVDDSNCKSNCLPFVAKL